MSKVFRRVAGASPWIHILQRRYQSIKSKPTVDAKIEFDLRTAFPADSKQLVKSQPQWLQATYDALANKRSNLEVGIGAIFPYDTCDAVSNKKILDHISNTWIATKPILDVMQKSW